MDIVTPNRHESAELIANPCYVSRLCLLQRRCRSNTFPIQRCRNQHQHSRACATARQSHRRGVASHASCPQSLIRPRSMVAAPCKTCEQDLRHQPLPSLQPSPSMKQPGQKQESSPIGRLRARKPTQGSAIASMNDLKDEPHSLATKTKRWQRTHRTAILQ